MIRKKHRYAFRLKDSEEEMLQLLRDNYRYKSDTEIIVLAISDLASACIKSHQAALEAAPKSMNLGNARVSDKKPAPKKGRKK